MKLNTYILLLYSYLFSMTTPLTNEKGCGYSGTKGKTIEKDLDDCFQREVKDSRLRMSLGYEKCFGFNYQHLNTTIAEPLDRKQKIANRALIDLSLETCVVTEEQEENEDRVELDRKLNNCKHYFNVIIQAMYNDDESVETYLDSQSKLIKPLLGSKAGFDKLKNKIVKIISPIDECKEPQALFRIRLIKKYLEMYLNRVVSPPLPSFNNENLDILEHPEVYMLKSNKVIRTDIQELLESKRKKGKFVPVKRTIVIQKRKNAHDEEVEEEKKKSIVDKLLGVFKKDNDDNDDIDPEMRDAKRGEKEENTKKNRNHPEDDMNRLIDDADTDNEDNFADKFEDEHFHEPNSIVIDDFWDENLEIKNKRLGNHDFDRYKIKGFDIDRQLKKLFKI